MAQDWAGYTYGELLVLCTCLTLEEDTQFRKEGIVNWTDSPFQMHTLTHSEGQ